MLPQPPEAVVEHIVQGPDQIVEGEAAQAQGQKAPALPAPLGAAQRPGLQRNGVGVLGVPGGELIALSRGKGRRRR